MKLHSEASQNLISAYRNFCTDSNRSYKIRGYCSCRVWCSRMANGLFITTACLFFIACFIERGTSFQRSYSGARFVAKVYKASTEDISTESGLTSSGLESFKAPAYEIDRRRNFAIISHPDAGKTTLTEKLLLFGGAIQDAGAVKARGDQRKVTSDWMEIEKARFVLLRIEMYSKEVLSFWKLI